MKVIDEQAFARLSGLRSIIIPEGVTTIGRSAFSDCYNLTSVSLPDSLTTIDVAAFEDCTKLSSIDIPMGVTQIGAWAFAYCESLTRVDVPAGVTKVGEYAFAYCSNLESLYFWRKESFGISSLTVPSNVTIYCYRDSGLGNWIDKFVAGVVYLDGKATPTPKPVITPSPAPTATPTPTPSPTPMPPVDLTNGISHQVQNSKMYITLPAGSTVENGCIIQLPSPYGEAVERVQTYKEDQAKARTLEEMAYFLQYISPQKWNEDELIYRTVNGIRVLTAERKDGPVYWTSAYFECGGYVYEVEMGVELHAYDALRGIIDTLTFKGTATPAPTSNAGSSFTIKLSGTDVYATLPAGSKQGDGTSSSPCFTLPEACGGNKVWLSLGEYYAYSGEYVPYKDLYEAEAILKPKVGSSSLSWHYGDITVLMHKQSWGTETEMELYFESGDRVYVLETVDLETAGVMAMNAIRDSLTRKLATPTPPPTPTPTPTPTPMPELTPATITVRPGEAFNITLSIEAASPEEDVGYVHFDATYAPVTCTITVSLNSENSIVAPECGLSAHYSVSRTGGLVPGKIGVVGFAVNADAIPGEYQINVWGSGGVVMAGGTTRIIVLGCAHANVVNDELVPPTCTESGLMAGKHCADCGEVLLAQEVIPALSPDGTHSFTGNVTQAKAPTCTEDGSRLIYCIRCMAYMEEPIPAYGHAEGEKVIVTEPSVTTPGTAMVCCETCGELIRMEEIPALGIARIPGDANEDGMVDIMDALLTLQYAVGWDVQINADNADVNGDGTVDIMDALLVLQHSVGWDVELQ